jgi:hypothetical protein
MSDLRGEKEMQQHRETMWREKQHKGRNEIEKIAYMLKNERSP